MQIGVLGRGIVGRTLSAALVEFGHDVTIGSRSADNTEAQAGATDIGARATDFAGAVAGADLVINALPGLVTLEVFAPLAASLSGVTVVDISNPLDFSRGFPPSIQQVDGASIGEQLQALLPTSAVVKSLNTVTADIMVNPELIEGDHNVFLCGNDEAAKLAVKELLGAFGWADDQVIDLGDITAARATETFLQLWLRLMGVLGTSLFNISVIPAVGATHV